MNKGKFLALLAAGISTTSCTSIGNQLSDIVFIPHANSDKRANERVQLELGFRSCPKPPSLEEAGPAFLAAPIALDFAGQVLAAEAERYEATYSAGAANDGFYCKTDGKMQFAALKLTRTTGNGDNSALSFCAAVIPSDGNGIFRVVPLSYSLRRSKAKVVAFDLLSPFGVDLFNPWEIVTDPIQGEMSFIPRDNDLDLRITMTLSGMWVKEEKFHNEQLHSHTWNFRDVGLGSEVNLTKINEFSNCEQLDVQELANEVNTKKELFQKTDPEPDNSVANALAGAGYFPNVPRSEDKDGDNGNGVFSVNLEVVEFDEYGTRIQEVSSTFNKNKDNISSKLTDFID